MDLFDQQPLQILQCLHQAHLLAADERLKCHQAAVKGPLLIVAPNLGGDGVGFSNRHRVISAAHAIDKRFLASIRTLTCRLPLLLRWEGGFLKPFRRC